MKYPEDFSWKQRLVVNSPKISAMFAGCILIAGAIFNVQKAFIPVRIFLSILMAVFATFLMLVGHGLTLTWKENLQEDLGGDSDASE